MTRGQRFTWVLFLCMHELNMTRQEVLVTRWGELEDLISCLSIYNGSARLISGSSSHRITNYDQAIMVR